MLTFNIVTAGETAPGRDWVISRTACSERDSVTDCEANERSGELPHQLGSKR